jgi:hypothetical protein
MDDRENAEAWVQMSWPEIVGTARKTAIEGFMVGLSAGRSQIASRSEGEASSRLADLIDDFAWFSPDDWERRTPREAQNGITQGVMKFIRDLRALMQPAPEAAPDATRTCRVTREYRDEGNPRSGWTQPCRKPLPCPDHPEPAACDHKSIGLPGCPTCDPSVYRITATVAPDAPRDEVTNG